MQQTRRVWRVEGPCAGVLLAFALAIAPAQFLRAQDSSSPPFQLNAVAALPEAPSPSTELGVPGEPPRELKSEVQPPGSKPPGVASQYAGVIHPGQIAPPLTGHDKLLMGLRRTVSPMAMAGWLFSAGYGQLNDTPHYGSDRAGFGERLGAAAIRDASEAVFTDGFAARAFHQDPRYYRLGDGRSVRARIGNAALQPFWTRTDSHRRAINISLMTGTLAGSALTNAYYPKVDRGVGQTFETFAFSMEGSVVGNLVREFFPDLSDLIFSKVR